MPHLLLLVVAEVVVVKVVATVVAMEAVTAVEAILVVGLLGKVEARVIAASSEHLHVKSESSSRGSRCQVSLPTPQRN